MNRSTILLYSIALFFQVRILWSQSPITTAHINPTQSLQTHCEDHALAKVGQKDSNATVIGILRIPGNCPGGIKLLGEFACLAFGESGLRIVDVSEPSAPIKVASLALSENDASNITVNGSYAYVSHSTGNKNGGLSIIDMSNPSGPDRKAFYSTEEVCVWNVAVWQDYAYLCTNYGFQIIDISDRSDPVNVSSSWSFLDIHAIALNYPYAYINEITFGSFRVIDVSQTDFPQLMGSLHLDDPDCWNMSASGDYVYFADEWIGGLRIIDVTDSRKPVEVTFIRTSENPDVPPSSSAWDVAVEGNFVYLANHERGLRIIDA